MFVFCNILCNSHIANGQFNISKEIVDCGRLKDFETKHKSGSFYVSQSHLLYFKPFHSSSQLRPSLHN